jgi:hypothetical protein
MNNEGPADLFFKTFAELLDVNAPEIKIVACYEDFFQVIIKVLSKNIRLRYFN